MCLATRPEDAIDIPQPNCKNKPLVSNIAQVRHVQQTYRNRLHPNNPLLLSIRDDAEGLVVVLGVKPHVRVCFAPAAGHNAPLPPMIHSGCVHGVFAVIVTANVRELFFMVAEPFVVVLRVFVGAAGQNVVNGVHGLLG